MKVIVFLCLFSFPAWAAEKPPSWRLVWEVALPGKPVAAFFSAELGKILVSVKGEKGKSIVAALSDEGRWSGKPLADSKGEAGPLRAFEDQIYWAVGQAVVRFPSGGGSPVKVADFSEAPLDLAVERTGRLVVAGKGAVRDEKGSVGPGSSGLFVFSQELYSLEGGTQLRPIPGPGKAEILCREPCKGLERAPSGGWITVAGWDVVLQERGSRSVLVRGPSEPGRISYVYRRDSRNDLLLVPFPQEGKVRAYQQR